MRRPQAKAVAHPHVNNIIRRANQLTTTRVDDVARSAHRLVEDETERLVSRRLVFKSLVQRVHLLLLVVAGNIRVARAVVDTPFGNHSFAAEGESATQTQHDLRALVAPPDPKIESVHGPPVVRELLHVSVVLASVVIRGQEREREWERERERERVSERE